MQASLQGDIIMSDGNPRAVVVTDAYLNDPIAFTPDVRFSPESALRLMPSQSVAERDTVGYLQINLNSSKPQHYIVPMISTALTRDDFYKVVDTQFTQLLASR